MKIINIVFVLMASFMLSSCTSLYECNWWVDPGNCSIMAKMKKEDPEVYKQMKALKAERERRFRERNPGVD